MACFAPPAAAQLAGADSLIVTFKSGATATYALANLRRVTFDVKPAGVEAEHSKPGALALAPSYPNPTRSATSIDVTLGEPGAVTIDIASADGAIVRRLNFPACHAGHNLLPWDGLDERGNAAPGGTYLWRVHYGGETLTAKTLIVR